MDIMILGLIIVLFAIRVVSNVLVEILKMIVQIVIVHLLEKQLIMDNVFVKMGIMMMEEAQHAPYVIQSV